MAGTPRDRRGRGMNVLMLLILLVIVAAAAAWAWQESPPGTPAPSGTAAAETVPGGQPPAQ